MEELGSLWNYQEDFDELKLKLQYTTIELESVKMETNEQIRKYREEVKYLLNLLKLAYQERDEARDQLQKLLNKLMPSSPSELQQTILPYPQPESPLLLAAKANSSITESNSLSDTYNNQQSHGSTPVDSFFDSVTSPDFSSINMADSGGMGFVNVNQPLVQDYNNNGSVPSGLVSSMVTKVVVDPADTVIDSLAKAKTLPQKGKLLQAVMEAGPLLQTLLVAGSLPEWRNPPPLQAFKIPPVSIKVCDSKSANQKPAANPNRTIAQKRLNPPSCPETSRQMCSAAMLNFANSASALGLSNAQLLSAGAGFNTQITAGKRQSVYEMSKNKAKPEKFVDITDHSMPSGPSPAPASTSPSPAKPWDPLVFAVVAILCLIFLVFSYCGVLKRLCCKFTAAVLSRNRVQRRLPDDTNIDNNDNNNNNPSSQNQSNALESSVIYSLPISQFKKGNREEPPWMSNTDCAVCLAEFEEGEWLRHLPNCTHGFHISCVDTWFQSHSSCPLCRSSVSDVITRPECSVSVFTVLETLRREDFLPRQGSTLPNATL
ncbi:hypothetical protein PTKIN_Ptkin11bG0021800 [Pterospermum kingtungense]